MTSILAKVNGYKTYILCTLGIIVVVVNHYFGPIQGVSVGTDDKNWLDTIYQLLLVMAGRSAVNKI